VTSGPNLVDVAVDGALSRVLIDLPNDSNPRLREPWHGVWDRGWRLADWQLDVDLVEVVMQLLAHIPSADAPEAL
jgi:hypothetical protein